MLIQSGMSLLHSAPMPLQDGDDKGSFCRKVMMDTSFPDVNRIGDVGVTEGGESSLQQESMGYIHDAFCSISRHIR